VGTDQKRWSLHVAMTCSLLSRFFVPHGILQGEGGKEEGGGRGEGGRDRLRRKELDRAGFLAFSLKGKKRRKGGRGKGRDRPDLVVVLALLLRSRKKKKRKEKRGREEGRGERDVPLQLA